MHCCQAFKRQLLVGHSDSPGESNYPDRCVNSEPAGRDRTDISLMSISWPAFLFVVLAVFATLPAQQACPPATLQAAAEANLVPSASSYQVLLRQDDGSYSAYEITNGAPYQVLSTLPNFQRQLRTCSMVTPALAPYEIGVNAPRGPDGVFARLPSGGYLFVDTYSAFASTIENIQATVFDRNLNQVS